MGLDHPIDITTEQRKIILSLLDKHLPNTTTWVYGSRAKWNARPESDLDMVVFAKPEQSDQVIELREAFEESDLPFRVDLFIWDTVSENFREQITADHVPLRERSDPGSRRSRKTVKLEDAVDLRLSSVDKKTKRTEQAVQLCNYMDVYNNNFLRSNMKFMHATANEREIAKCSLFPGDVVITKDSEKYDDIGIPAMVRGNIPGLVCGYHLAILRPRTGMLDGAYLLYALNSVGAQNQFHAYANGVTRFGLRKADIGRVEIPLPPLSEQRAIAHILGTLDDKIELNQRMNKTLEGMAQGLFKSWFVDFDPVHAKAALKRNPVTNVSPDPKLVTHDQTAAALHNSRNATSIGTTKENWTSERARTYLNKMDTSVAALFPDSFSDSELGKIPAEWKVRSLKDLLELAYGKTLKARNRHGGAVPVYGSNGQIGWHNRKLVDGPGIVVGRKGNPGRVTWVFTDFYPIDTTFYVVPKNGKRDIQFLFYALKSQDLPSIAADSAVPGLNRKLAYMNKQAIPTDELIDQFNKITTPIFARCHSLDVESRILVAAREALLPKLLSGTIRTSNSCMEVSQ